jgi:2-iminobutanoate/2-iminopropanoate deaminase
LKVARIKSVGDTSQSSIINRQSKIVASMETRNVKTPNAPSAAGHYSQAVVSNGLIFVSGQLSIDPATGEKKLGSIEEQTTQALKNVLAIVEAAGSDINHILKTTVYVADIELWAKVNEVYAKFMGEHRPARAVIPVGPLHYGFLLEIEAVAALKDR